MALSNSSRAGMSRRELIRNAGIAGAAAWTAPVLLQSAAMAQTTQCSPVACEDFYFAKWEGTDPNKCPTLNGVLCQTSGSPQCGTPSGTGICAGTNAATISCQDGLYRVTVPSNCTLTEVAESKANQCTDYSDQLNECSTSFVFPTANPSHVLAAWCCS